MSLYEFEGRLRRAIRERRPANQQWIVEERAEADEVMSLSLNEAADLAMHSADLLCDRCHKRAEDCLNDGYPIVWCEACRRSHKSAASYPPGSMGEIYLPLVTAGDRSAIDPKSDPLNVFSGWKEIRSRGRHFRANFDRNGWSVLEDWVMSHHGWKSDEISWKQRSEVASLLVEDCKNAPMSSHLIAGLPPEEKKAGEAFVHAPENPECASNVEVLRSGWERITSDDSTKIITYDGTEFSIDDPSAFRIIAKLIDLRGIAISGEELRELKGCRGKRIDQVIRDLHPKLKGLILSKPGNNGGYWITLPKLGRKQADRGRRTSSKK